MRAAPTAFDGLDIRLQGGAYHVGGAGWRGSILAGGCFQAEDDGEYFEPGPFADSLAS